MTDTNQTNTSQCAAALTVLYDGACPLCRREIAVYRSLRVTIKILLTLPLNVAAGADLTKVNFRSASTNSLKNEKFEDRQSTRAELRHIG